MRCASALSSLPLPILLISGQNDERYVILYVIISIIATTNSLLEPP